MPGWKRVSMLVLLLSALFGAQAAALAAQPQVLAFTAAETEDEADEPAANESGVVPAVEAPPASDEDEDQPWTARFLAPTLLALGIVITAAATGYYATRVRGRYRVVE